MGHACCHPPHCHYDNDYHCNSEPVYCQTNNYPPNYKTMYPQSAPVHPLSFPPGPPGPSPLMYPPPGPPGPPGQQLFNTPYPKF